MNFKAILLSLIVCSPLVCGQPVLAQFTEQETAALLLALCRGDGEFNVHNFNPQSCSADKRLLIKEILVLQEKETRAQLFPERDNALIKYCKYSTDAVVILSFLVLSGWIIKRGWIDAKIFSEEALVELAKIAIGSNVIAVFAACGNMWCIEKLKKQDELCSKLMNIKIALVKIEETNALDAIEAQNVVVA